MRSSVASSTPPASRRAVGGGSSKRSGSGTSSHLPSPLRPQSSKKKEKEQAAQGGWPFQSQEPEAGGTGRGTGPASASGRPPWPHLGVGRVARQSKNISTGMPRTTGGTAVKLTGALWTSASRDPLRASMLSRTARKTAQALGQGAAAHSDPPAYADDAKVEGRPCRSVDGAGCGLMLASSGQRRNGLPAARPRGPPPQRRRCLGPAPAHWPRRPKPGGGRPRGGGAGR